MSANQHTYKNIPHRDTSEIIEILDRLAKLKRAKPKRNQKNFYEEVFSKVSGTLITIAILIYTAIISLAAWSSHIEPISTNTKNIASTAAIICATLALVSFIIFVILAGWDLLKKENSLFSIFKNQAQNDLKNAESICDIDPHLLKTARALLETKIKRTERKIGALIGSGSLTILTSLKFSWEALEKLEKNGFSIWQIINGGYAESWPKFAIYAASIIFSSCVFGTFFASLELRKIRYAVEISELSQSLRSDSTQLS